MTQSLNKIEIYKTACVTGHRKLRENFNEENLEEVFYKTVKNGYRKFLIGMAIGFDSKCFKVLLKIKKEYDIKIIACIPCLNQEKNFSNKEKEEYYELLDKADEKVYLSLEYKKNCMNLRNFYMVDNSSLVIAYLKKNKGGTFNTVSYAKRKEKEIIYID